MFSFVQGVFFSCLNAMIGRGRLWTKSTLNILLYKILFSSLTSQLINAVQPSYAFSGHLHDVSSLLFTFQTLY